MSGGHLSKEFFELVKSIGESRSKQEEDKIIVTEIAILKAHLNQPAISAKKMKEYMVRAVYAEMLGHDASFAYIHAVKLTHEKNLFAKRIGYLTCNLFLHKDHELMLLLINTMQRDLQSANHLEVGAALTSVTRLVNLEMIPAISPLVFKLLGHPQEVVRKKAIVAVNRIYRLDSSIVMDHKDVIRKVLCDPDPSVMGASLHILCDITKGNPSLCKDLVPSFVSILKQITEHRLPRDFDYHRMPAPWLQVKLVNILGLLGTADQKSSQQMYEILQECMRRADSGVNVGYAIIYECVRCITRIYPDQGLLQLAASNISRFISSDNHNLKYLGVTGLAQIVQVNPSYAAEHQMVVVDCLEDPDETLKRKTLDLLFRMTNPQNVTVVVDKLVFHLRTSVDVHLRGELVQRVTSLAERFAPDNEWYLNTMNTVFELGGNLVPAETAYNLMRLVAEGTGEDEDADQAFRTFAVNTYLKLLEKPSITDVLVQVIAWVLGEYARLATVDGYSIEDIIDLLCDCIDRPFEDLTTRGYIVTALMKLFAQFSVKSSAMDNVIKNYRSSRLTDLQQRCYEFEQLRKTPPLMQKVLPYDASCEDIVMSKDLAFLNGFVQSKLADGAKPYLDAITRAAMKEAAGPDQLTESAKPTLNFTPYSAPTKPTPGGSHLSGESMDSSSISNDFGSSITEKKPVSLQVNGPRKWGPTGYAGPTGSTPAPAPPPVQPSAPEPPPYSSNENAFRPPPKPAETGPPVLTEREKTAAALFGGLTGSKAPATSATAKAKPPAPVAAAPVSSGLRPQVSATQAPTPAPQVQPVADLNLLDFEGPTPAPLAPVPSQPAPPAASGNDFLLMDLTMDHPAVSSAPAHPPPITTTPLSLQPAAMDPAMIVAGPSILAPLQVTTQQVGQMWGSLPIERKLVFASTVQNCQDMMNRLRQHLNVHCVEIIGVEGIAAGRVLPGQDPCFLHGKVLAQRVEMLVRCRDAGVAQRVMEHIQRAMA